MTAFDPQLLGQLFATPKFQRDFGYHFHGPDGWQWIISAPWQTGLLMVTLFTRTPSSVSETFANRSILRDRLSVKWLALSSRPTQWSGSDGRKHLGYA
jgi:hypothetical protein